MRVYRSGIPEIIIIPHIIQNLFPGKGDSLVFHKISEKLKLLKAQINTPVADRHHVGGFVQMDSSFIQHLSRCGFSCPSQNGFHTGDQNLGAERLGNIFVHTEFEALQFILLIPSGRKHNNGYSGIIPDFPAHLPPIHFRHHDIQYDQGNIVLGKENIQRFTPVSRFQNLIIIFLKKILYQFAHPAFVIHNQYFRSFHDVLRSEAPFAEGSHITDPISHFHRFGIICFLI